MIPGVTALGEIAVGGIPSEVDKSTASPFWAFVQDQYALRNFVLVANPPDLTSEAGMFPYALGTVALGDAIPPDTTHREPFYWDVKGLETGSDDMPASKVFKPYLKNPFSFTASIPFPGEFSGSGSSQLGVITLANTGDLDPCLIGSDWAGSQIDMYLGGTLHPGRSTEKALKFSEYQKLYTLNVSNIRVSDDESEIVVEDPRTVLETIIQTSEYTGAGYLEGVDDIKGQSKPFMLGKVYHISPVPVNADEFIFQYHDGSGTSVDKVYDNGIELTFEGDSTDLLNTTVLPLYYKTDVSRGLIRVGSEPKKGTRLSRQRRREFKRARRAARKVTQGPITLTGTGLGGTTISSIVQYLAESVNLSLDGATFNQFGQYNSGYWCDTSPESIESVISELMGSIDGWWIFRRNGNLALGEHQTLYDAPVKLTLEGRENSDTPNVITSITRKEGPPNIWRLSLGYRPYWSTGDSDDTVDADVRADMLQEFRRANVSTNTSTKSRFKDAITSVVNSGINNLAQAQELSDAVVLRDAVKRGIYDIEIHRDVFKLVPGDTVLIYHDRFLLQMGRKGVVISVSEDAETETSVLSVLINE